MTTAQKIIDRAFSKATIRAAETPLSAAELSDGLDVLNDLLATWDAVGILKGVAPVIDLDDDLGEPRYATWALKANVCALILGEYGIPTSAAQAKDAAQSLAWLTTASTNLQDVEFPSTLPLGSGNRDEFGFGYDRDFFPENSKENF